MVKDGGQAFKIGNCPIKNRVVLGPMAGITDMPYRALCIEQGAALTYTEMISAKGLHYKNRNSLPLLAVGANESPVAIQLFGSEPELMAEEALKLEDGPYDIFDINMGCPMPKIVNNGEGSALMKDPLLAGHIVEAMVKVLKKPVTVKIRKGFDDSSVNAAEFARVCEEAGASAVAVHGRTREQYYSGQADWDIIRKVKETVRIPVIGSGDVRCGEDAKRMLDETGCDAVMIARAAQGNPWIFSEINAYLETGKEPERPEIEEIKSTILRHFEAMLEFAGEWSAVRQMRKHVSFYVTGLPNATTIRREINKAETEKEFLKILSEWM